MRFAHVRGEASEEPAFLSLADGLAAKLMRLTLTDYIIRPIPGAEGSAVECRCTRRGPESMRQATTWPGSTPPSMSWRRCTRARLARSNSDSFSAARKTKRPIRSVCRGRPSVATSNSQGNRSTPVVRGRPRRLTVWEIHAPTSNALLRAPAIPRRERLRGGLRDSACACEEEARREVNVTPASRLSESWAVFRVFATSVGWPQLSVTVHGLLR
jgi:hypothetical protein